MTTVSKPSDNIKLVVNSDALDKLVRTAYYSWVADLYDNNCTTEDVPLDVFVKKMTHLFYLYFNPEYSILLREAMMEYYMEMEYDLAESKKILCDRYGLEYKPDDEPQIAPANDEYAEEEFLDSKTGVDKAIAKAIIEQDELIHDIPGLSDVDLDGFMALVGTLSVLHPYFHVLAKDIEDTLIGLSWAELDEYQFAVLVVEGESLEELKSTLTITARIRKWQQVSNF